MAEVQKECSQTTPTTPPASPSSSAPPPAPPPPSVCASDDVVSEDYDEIRSMGTFKPFNYVSEYSFTMNNRRSPIGHIFSFEFYGQVSWIVVLKPLSSVFGSFVAPLDLQTFNLQYANFDRQIGLAFPFNIDIYEYKIRYLFFFLRDQISNIFNNANGCVPRYIYFECFIFPQQTSLHSINRNVYCEVCTRSLESKFHLNLQKEAWACEIDKLPLYRKIIQFQDDRTITGCHRLANDVCWNADSYFCEFCHVKIFSLIYVATPEIDSDFMQLINYNSFFNVFERDALLNNIDFVSFWKVCVQLFNEIDMSNTAMLPRQCFSDKDLISKLLTLYFSS